MDRSRTTARHSIRRIVAVLLAFAELAERAGDRSAAVRGLVLWLLRSGEALARDHAAGLAWAGQAEPLPFMHDSAAEAIRLAASFRQLAAALVALAVDSLTPSGQVQFARLASLAATDPAVFSGSISVVERRDSS